jgi:pimeloyl-ACP methyl ester carboxylesterase
VKNFKLYATVLAIVAALLSSLNVSAADSTAKPMLTLQELRTKYADRAGHITSIDGIDIYYKDEGKGPAILMVHGSVSTLKTYDFVAAKLTRRYRVIRYDVPGQGLSGPISDDAAARIKPTDIAEQLLAKLGVTSVTAVGVSSGGTLCFNLAAKRPDLVKRLILANTPADPVEGANPKPSKDFAAAQLEARQTGFQNQFFWDSFLFYFAGEPERMSPGIREQFYDFNRRVPEPNALTLIAKVKDHEATRAALAAVTTPTLLIWGSRDALLTPASADVLAGYLTHAAPVSTVFLPDVGHFPPLEVPERFAQIVANYIEAVAPVEPKAPAPQDR